MKHPAVGAGSQYLRSARDRHGDWLNGSSHYRLRVPPDAPTGQFWSVTVYDSQTRSMIQTDTNIAARSSYDRLAANNDGSVELHFGPTPPAGRESNWIKTLPGTGWFAWFRVYAPGEPFFEKTWRLPDIEKTGPNPPTPDD